jgi:endonuclease G
MQMSKKQRFGLITFILLLAAAYLVTVEPWKKWGRDLQADLPVALSLTLSGFFDGLESSHPRAAEMTDTIRSYLGFDLGYNERYEQASWVTYVLTREEIEGGHVDRTDDFRADTTISTGSAQLADFRGSGFDRGHLAPAADMKWSQQAMSESFLLTNMSPQNPSFNRGIWRRLEEQVRRWAVEKDSILVICGPVLQEIDSFIGENQVGIPPAYFKVLADLSPPGHSMIAFLLPNDRSDRDPIHFAVTVDSLEQVTGYDFFASASDPETVEWFEGRLDLSGWD